MSALSCRAVRPYRITPFYVSREKTEFLSPLTKEVRECVERIVVNRKHPKVEPIIKRSIFTMQRLI